MNKKRADKKKRVKMWKHKKKNYEKHNIQETSHMEESRKIYDEMDRPKIYDEKIKLLILEPKDYESARLGVAPSLPENWTLQKNEIVATRSNCQLVFVGDFENLSHSNYFQL